jgi:hypothetical protein
VRVTDYRREPFAQSEWLHGLSGLKRPDAEELTEHYSVLVSRGAATMMNHTRVRRASGKSAIMDGLYFRSQPQLIGARSFHDEHRDGVRFPL